MLTSGHACSAYAPLTVHWSVIGGLWLNPVSRDARRDSSCWKSDTYSIPSGVDWHFWCDRSWCRDPLRVAKNVGLNGAKCHRGCTQRKIDVHKTCSTYSAERLNSLFVQRDNITQFPSDHTLLNCYRGEGCHVYSGRMCGLGEDALAARPVPQASRFVSSVLDISLGINLRPARVYVSALL